MKAKTASQIRLDAIDFQKIKVVAESESRSLNNLLEFLVRKEIARYEQENGEIVLEKDD